MKKYTLLLLLLLAAVAASAAPARRVSTKVMQSDGTELTVVLTGDEAMHFYTTLDGKPLIKEINGDFSYATYSNEGKFVSTRCLAHDKGSRTIVEKAIIEAIDYEGMGIMIDDAANARAAKFRTAARKAGSQIAPVGDVNIAVVLVQFQDVKFTYTKEDISNLLNTEGYKLDNPFAESVGSARDYFLAQSDGKFRPNFLVTDIVTLDYDMEYYGGNNSDGDDKKASYAVREGIKKADATFDFSVCDNNGDGEVEFVYCIYAGYSESYGASENTIWPHQWTLSAQAGSITADRVKCDTYACSGELVYSEKYEPEIGKVLAGIGLICHEFSHCLGLHDIYDTTYKSGNWCMDYWDVMDQGNYAAEGYVPVGYSAYQRDFCGWRKLEVIDEKGDYSMLPLTQGGVAYKVVNDANPDEYYILENRKQESWDTYLFNSGMLVVHVDYQKSAWDNNTINTIKGHPRYTIIPADNDLALYGEVSASEFVASLKGDVWPGTSGNTELTNTSIPAAKVYKGGYMNKPIRNIKYENDVISFNFMGGVFESVPQVLPATDVAETSFVANWEPLEGAEEYAVELYKVSEVKDGTGDLVTLLSEDFIGFTKANEDITTSIDSYTLVKGWAGSKLYSEGGVLRVGTSSTAGYVRTPEMNAAGSVSVSFMTMLYNDSDAGVVLTVSIKDSNDNVVVSKDIFPTSELVEYEFDANIKDTFYLEFSTYSSTAKKRVMIDNVAVVASSSIVSELVENVVTSGCSHKFEELESGARYCYRIQACDNYGSSGYSDYEEVVLFTTGVDGIVTDGPLVEVYTLAGVKVFSGSKMAMKISVPGVYVVRTASGSYKYVVK